MQIQTENSPLLDEKQQQESDNLEIAVETNEEVAKWLVSVGADKNIKTNDDKTALDYARKLEHQGIVNLLRPNPPYPFFLQHLKAKPKRLTDELPDELLVEIGAHLSHESDISSLVSTSRRLNSIFQPTRLLDKFLQRVAYGEQDKAERLFIRIYRFSYPENQEKIQEALCCQRRFTDYSGRTFHCSAYEYAYWAKDTHMCRMLERYMNYATKAQMLARINEIEHIDEATGKPVGLKYQQNGKEYRSAHFDLTPLKQALRTYIDAFNQRPRKTDADWESLDKLWLKVGLLQRDVPAHIAQEYCHPNRSFEDVSKNPSLLYAHLVRRLNFYNFETGKYDLWFTHGCYSTNSGLGFSFAILCRRLTWLCGNRNMGVRGLRGGVAGWQVASDLAAIEAIDKARTDDLKRFLYYLSAPSTLPDDQSFAYCCIKQYL